MVIASYLPNVRDQYEAYPFPKREPEDERRRLIQCELDMLGKINHFGFAGRQSFGPGFRALVAGGGTGDAAIFLAEQLRRRGRAGRVTYVDISQSSLDTARKRAEVRGLTNIEWRHDSLLALPDMGLEPFDYINCVGVLHHLADPDAGLRSLASVLKPDGCMGLMVYGRYGRTDIYEIQDLMRLALAGEPDLVHRVAAARTVLERLPPNNIMMRGRDRAAALRFFLDDEPNLVDALLHEQDRPYSVTEIYEFLAGAGLHLVDFTNYHSLNAVCRLEYGPALYLAGLPVLERIRQMPLPVQQTVAEIINGSMGLHTFFAAPREDTRAVPEDDMVPFFLMDHAVEACTAAIEAPPGAIAVTLRLGLKIQLDLAPLTKAVLALVDGQTRLGLLFDRAAAHTSAPRAEVIAAFARDFTTLSNLEWVLLRHKDARAVETLAKKYNN